MSFKWISRRCPLDNENVCTLVSICMETLRFVFFFYLPICSVDFSMKSEWNESCTESISYKQVNSSIIKDQIGVLSLKCFGLPACT